MVSSHLLETQVSHRVLDMTKQTRLHTPAYLHHAQYICLDCASPAIIPPWMTGIEREGRRANRESLSHTLSSYEVLQQQKWAVFEVQLPKVCLSQCPCEVQLLADRSSLLGRMVSQAGSSSITVVVFSPHVLPGADGSSSAAPSSPSALFSNLKTILPLFYKNPGFPKTLIFFQVTSSIKIS